MRFCFAALLFPCLFHARAAAFQSCPKPTSGRSCCKAPASSLTFSTQNNGPWSKRNPNIRLLKQIQRIGPTKALEPWRWINASVLWCSVLILMELLATLAPEKRLEGTHAYLVYNFGATLIWVVQSSLDAVDFVCEPNNQAPSPPSDGILWLKQNSSWLLLLLEWTVAVYFLYDSVLVFQQWMTPDVDVRADFLDTSINAGWYLYQTLKLASADEEDTSSTHEDCDSK